jgi:hypothetical protein
METNCRRRSWLGASVTFLLIFGVINIALAILPATLHLNGSDAFPGVLLSGTGYAQLLGRSLAGLRHDNPRLDTLLVDSMTSVVTVPMGDVDSRQSLSCGPGPCHSLPGLVEGDQGGDEHRVTPAADQ